MRLLGILTIMTVLALIYPPQVVAWTMTAVGDVMLDRQVRTLVRRHGPTYPIAKISASLKGYDVILANLEGAFTANQSVATSDRLIFTFDPALAPLFNQFSPAMLSLANNHTLNFGRRGLDNTRHVLRQAGVGYFGDPRNLHGYGAVRTIRGTQLAFIGYHGLVGGLNTILQDIRESKKVADVTIVMPHWGAEYQLGISAKVQREAHQLIEAGADFVIGTHPHVVQPLEIYRGKFIAYSLGNFIFDQYWSAETQRQLLLHIDAKEKSTRIQLVPLVSVRSQALIADLATRQMMLERLARDSVVLNEQREQIRQGWLQL